MTENMAGHGRNGLWARVAGAELTRCPKDSRRPHRTTRRLWRTGLPAICTRMRGVADGKAVTRIPWTGTPVTMRPSPVLSAESRDALRNTRQNKGREGAGAPPLLRTCVHEPGGPVRVRGQSGRYFAAGSTSVTVAFS